MIVSLLIPVLAIVVPALFGLYYFWDQRRWERETITKALRGEMERIKDVLAISPAPTHARTRARCETASLFIVAAHASS
jgi:hypothetical protein